ncbi:putative glycosidase CRH2 [Tieghemiomyces parasiticus]|uniref:Glycosidase CRH2 n=1 Tax=Tieghemiomyces parasiticus TaxID=78921 RepID=A0A9W7ZHN5_9FUNG|nr:putative glycosidase CRH2 [Tieghemiomyces parasiticus]
MRVTAAVFLALAPFLATNVSAICKHFGGKCPREAPCCNDGWCSAEASACQVKVCDPANSFSTGSCQPEPVCVKNSDTFDQPKALVPVANFTGDPNRATWTTDFQPDKSYIKGGNMALYMTKDGDAEAGFGARVSSVRYVDYGSVSAHVRAASTGLGVVSSFIIKNEKGDEIDFEWVGLSPDKVQTNYYYAGILNYDNMKEFTVPGGDTVNTAHLYAINWDPDFIEWIVDGKVVRRLNRDDTLDPADKVHHFPARPAQVQFSIWDGGNAPSKWTRQWAGTPTDWSKAGQTYTMFVEDIQINCHFSGNKSGEAWPWDDMAKMTGNSSAAHDNGQATFSSSGGGHSSTSSSSSSSSSGGGGSSSIMPISGNGEDSSSAANRPVPGDVYGQSTTVFLATLSILGTAGLLIHY